MVEEGVEEGDLGEEKMWRGLGRDGGRVCYERKETKARKDGEIDGKETGVVLLEVGTRITASRDTDSEEDLGTMTWLIP
ncbi:hypothetical protein ACH5RR_008525 [Cinchona calisaya]|uniref:Uncharacterized protein n=1 Tax=Cinchona calisaya TaxID=153742 RepID=A0ABD3AHC6_9GENT